MCHVFVICEEVGGGGLLLEYFPICVCYKVNFWLGDRGRGDLSSSVGGS